MALSDDQRALLRLLAQREEGYEDIAALKGMSVGEVRAEVRAALAELDAPPPEPPPPPPPPEPTPTPKPVEPEPPAAREPAKAPRGPARPPLPVERRRFVLLAGGGLAIAAIVLGIAAIAGGGSDSGPGTAGGAVETELAAAEDGKVTQAVLEPADGSDAGGRAVFGRVGKEEIVLQVTAENLEPTDRGQSYTVWLYRTPKLSLRVGSVAVGEAGRLGARFTIPEELLAYVASGAFDQVYVSRTDDAAYRREVAKAKRNKSLPRYTGETVLTGEITGPVAKAGR
ncbi:MAG TPA: hypothetical protein VH703_02260 [Solirubrobacterales bacterium]|jgi:hypothetical protein